MRLGFQSFARYFRGAWSNKQVYATPIVRSTFRPVLFIGGATAASVFGASVYFDNQDQARHNATLEPVVEPLWPSLLSTALCQEEEEEGRKFPPAKLEVPGVLPLGLAAHSENVVLSHGRKNFTIDLAVFIDPMPTDLENPNKQGIPEELKILLKPTEPYDRCLVIRTKEKTKAEDFVNLLAEQVEQHALRKDRLEGVFDPSIMPKTPPKDALNKLKEAIVSEAESEHSGYLPEDSNLAFVWRKEGFLDVRLENSRISLILSPELSWAVFDSFFGPKSMAPDAKEAVVSGMRTQAKDEGEE
eukprot:gb/GECG01001810.1/.p1 GENE.gb/GECG01001810.1/~~gb/GECG01001810.1/.p1  ORF type:complete len:301 (+),score=43.89 gb/GECG01001810.1/:1-903(+)